MTSSDPRRLLSAGAVVLLHLGIVTAFLFAFRFAANVPYRAQEIEISLPVPVQRGRPNELPQELIRPVVPMPAAPRIPEWAPSSPSGTLPAPGAISGVGRALFGCAPENLERLPADQRAGCLRLPKGQSHEQSVRLGPPPDPGSPFTKEIEERFRRAQPINRPCAQATTNETLGLPCFGFDQAAPLLHGH